MKKIKLGLIVLIMGISLIGCASLFRATSTIVFTDGEAVSKHLGTVNYINAISGDGTGVITFTSENPSVATVEEDGTIVLLEIGTTVITANKAETETHNEVSASYTLTVTAALPSSTILFTEEGKITCALKRKTYTNTLREGSDGTGTISYSSSAPEVATIDAETGVVTFITTGSTVITADKAESTTHAAVNASYELIIQADVSFVEETYTVIPGETVQIGLSSADIPVTWKTYDTNYVSVSNTGLVTGIAKGEATITVTSIDDLSNWANCKVSVSALAVSDVTLPATLSVKVSRSASLTASISPSNATDQTVSWASSDDSIATVSTKGVVTGVASGTATITVTTTDGAKTASSQITVIAMFELTSDDYEYLPANADGSWYLSQGDGFLFTIKDSQEVGGYHLQVNKTTKGVVKVENKMSYGFKWDGTRFWTTSGISCYKK